MLKLMKVNVAVICKDFCECNVLDIFPKLKYIKHSKKACDPKSQDLKGAKNFGNEPLHSKSIEFKFWTTFIVKALFSGGGAFAHFVGHFVPVILVGLILNDTSLVSKDNFTIRFCILKMCGDRYLIICECNAVMYLFYR